MPANANPASPTKRTTIPRRRFSQYLGILGSICCAQRSIPPARLRTLQKPASRRNCTAFALRPPILQCTTISSAVESRFRFCGSVPSGIFTDSGKAQIANVHEDEVFAPVAHSFQVLDSDLGDPGRARRRDRRLLRNATELLVVDQPGDGGIRAADDAVRILPELQLAEPHRERVDEEEPSD